jgi:hypothetical protein
MLARRCLDPETGKTSSVGTFSPSVRTSFAMRRRRVVSAVGEGVVGEVRSEASCGEGDEKVRSVGEEAPGMGRLRMRRGRTIGCAPDASVSATAAFRPRRRDDARETVSDAVPNQRPERFDSMPVVELERECPRVKDCSGVRAVGTTRGVSPSNAPSLRVDRISRRRCASGECGSSEAYMRHSSGKAETG